MEPVSKLWNPKRPTVELQSSKIRREPPPPPKPSKVAQTLLPDDSERETWTLILGVAAFAVAITLIIFWISDFTSSSKQEQPPVTITLNDAN